MTTTNNEIGERVAVIEIKLDQVQNELADIKKLLTTDYAQTKQDVKELQETVDPLTKLRKKLWSVYVVTAISLAVLLTVIYESVKGSIK